MLAVRRYRARFFTGVLIAAVAQAIMEYGSATRFGMPTYPYVIVVAACALDFWVVKRSPGEAASAEEDTQSA
jgi:hypothetical protein